MRIEDEQITIDAPRERVWELIRDPADYPGLLDWVTTFEPRRRGRRTRRRARATRCGSGSARPTWAGWSRSSSTTRECDIVWTSVTGVEQRGRLRLRDAGQDEHRG